MISEAQGYIKNGQKSKFEKANENSKMRFWKGNQMLNNEIGMCKWKSSGWII